MSPAAQGESGWRAKSTIPALVIPAALLFVASEAGGVRLLALALLGLPLLAYLVAAPEQLLSLLVIVSISLGNAVGASGIDIGVRIYGLDILLVAGAAAALAMRAEHPSSGTAGDSRIWWITGTLVLYGLLSLMIGLGAHHAIRDSLGDFRRMFCYPLASFLIFRVYLRARGDLRSMAWLLGISGAVIMVIVATRVLTGSSYREQAFSVPGEAIRYLSYSEAAGASFLALAAVTGVFIARKPLRPLLLTVFTVAAVLVVMSNYRTAWLSLAFGLLASGVVAARRKLVWALRLLGTALLIGTAALLLLRASPLWPLLSEKFSTSNLISTGSWRLFSWAKAYVVWRQHPWFGVGLGYKHEFYRLGEGLQGLYLNKGNTIHNDLLWVLVNTGVVGAALLFWFFATILARALRSVRDLGTNAGSAGSVVVATCVGQLVVVTVTAMFQPTVSLGSNGVVLGLLAATLLEWGSGRRDQGAAPIPTVAAGAA